MWVYIAVYIFGVVSGVGLMALFCANGSDNDFHGGVA
jgi:hypothetical protein